MNWYPLSWRDEFGHYHILDFANETERLTAAVALENGGGYELRCHEAVPIEIDPGTYDRIRERLGLMKAGGNVEALLREAIG